MSEERKKKYGVEGEISADKIKNQSQNGAVKCVEILGEKEVDSYGQGIGSGAGYIELDNGTYN